MQRREFLKTTGAAAAATILRQPRPVHAADRGNGERPNLLVVITDQQFADAMSCAMGRDYIHTPNMDTLAAEGVRFTRAYCANPLCVPSRSSMFSGRYCHELEIQANESRKVDPDAVPCMGRIFAEAGYDTGFFGKWHMPWREKKPEENGFTTYLGRSCIYDGKPAAEFIAKERDRPFLAVASFMNPHNVCELGRGQTLPGGPIGDPPPIDQCPPAPANLEPPENETDIISHMRKGYQAHRLFPVGDFTADKWREYRWGYYRLVEKVDRHIGTLLAALRKSGLDNNTVVVFLSDHGECHGAHRWNQKTVFYDESVRVPLIVRQKDTTPTATCNTLVQTGVDLIPTLCDFAGINTPDGLPGQSLKPLALGQTPDLQRPCVVASNKMVQCEPVDGVMLQPDGRMVRSEHYKYCLYSLGNRRESLVDMKTDKGEMANLADKPELREVLLAHREYLRAFAGQYRDDVALAMLDGLS